MKKKDKRFYFNLLIIILILVILLLLITTFHYKSLSAPALDDVDDVDVSNDVSVIEVDISNINKKDLLSKDELIVLLENNSSEFLEVYKPHLENPFTYFKIESEDISTYKQTYSFAFDKNALETYNFEEPIVNDYMIFLDNLVLVYSPSTDSVKSIFFVGSIN